MDLTDVDSDGCREGMLRSVICAQALERLRGVEGIRQGAAVLFRPDDDPVERAVGMYPVGRPIERAAIGAAVDHVDETVA